RRRNLWLEATIAIGGCLADRIGAEGIGMRQFAAIIALLVLTAGTAHADNCNKSREYLLGGLAGDLIMPPQAYEGLFKVCTATAAMPNVKDAYILKDGGIAVIPKQDT